MLGPAFGPATSDSSSALMSVRGSGYEGDTGQSCHEPMPVATAANPAEQASAIRRAPIQLSLWGEKSIIGLYRPCGPIGDVSEGAQEPAPDERGRLFEITMSNSQFSGVSLRTRAGNVYRDGKSHAWNGIARTEEGPPPWCVCASCWRRGAGKSARRIAYQIAERLPRGAKVPVSQGLSSLSVAATKGMLRS
jgi:hypothetical protein